MGRPRKNEPVDQEDIVISVDEGSEEETEVEEINLSSMIEEVVEDKEEVQEIPARTDPGWTDYVISHLTEKEIDEAGNPKVLGLLRLAEKFNGPIVDLDTSVFADPCEANGWRCVTKARITFQNDDGDKSFSGIADACPKNIRGKDDSIFKQFAVTISETRSIGRAARNSLLLSGVVTSEECVEPDSADPIQSFQINSIDLMCKRLNLDVMKVIGSKFNSIHDMPRNRASVLIGMLNSYERSEGDPKVNAKFDKLKGYKTDWRRN